ncbi:MAG: zinc ribbon domain-containing protein [Armatimonadota bacterium]|jgi:hypothetical protein
MSERTCPNCGETVPDANYCAECGGAMNEPDRADEVPEADSRSAETLLPPPPPEETEDIAAPPEPPEVAGAELSGSELPPTEPPTDPVPFDAPSAQERGEFEERAEDRDEEGVGPDDVMPRGPRHDPLVAGATPMQQAAEAARAPAPPVDGQLRCPGCGESVYEGERVCWSCSRHIEAAQVSGAPVEAEGQPTGPPASGAPIARPAPAQAATPRREAMTIGGVGAEGYPSAAAAPQQRVARRPSDEAVAHAWWAFGLGLLAVFTCGLLGALGIPSLWLGISAARRNAGPVAIAGAIFGAIGLLMFIIWAIFFVSIPMTGRPSPTHIILPGFM